MKYKKRDIKTGCWVCLDNMPWFPDSARRGEDKRTLAEMRELFPTVSHSKPYFKVTTTRPEMTYQYRCIRNTYRSKFYMKWVTDVQASYKGVIANRK
jgi:hypothetical protein